MIKKAMMVGGLAIAILLSLLAGCTTNSTTGVSSSVTQSKTAVFQQVAAPAPTTTSTPVPSPQPSFSLSPQISVVSNAPVVVNLPNFADLLSVAEHTVVKIDTTGTGTDRFGNTVPQQGAGSGWIMDPNGIIVTNNHVVSGASTIVVTTLDGSTYDATVLAADATNDLALLKINASLLPVLSIGDASKLRVGDWVLAIGNPLGEGIIATQGIVSRLGVNAQVSATENYNDLIETTAAINPGNSGGPLVNMSGQVIGITSLGVGTSGIQGMSYAINMVDALPIIQKLTTQ